MDVEKFGEIIGASVASGFSVTPEQVAGVLSDEELFQEIRNRGLGVGSLAVDSATDTPEVLTPETADLFNTLTPEQQERATVLQSAMVERFSTKEISLSPEDFGLVVVLGPKRYYDMRGLEPMPEESRERRTFVMLITGNGLYKGSYDNIMNNKKANKEAYMVEVDGKQIDTREAMTWDLYQAFINQAKADGVNPLPDSAALSKENGQPWTKTWLTGEPAGGLRADSGDVRERVARRYWYYRYDVWRDMRVRPAAEV